MRSMNRSLPPKPPDPHTTMQKAARLCRTAFFFCSGYDRQSSRIWALCLISGRSPCRAVSTPRLHDGHSLCLGFGGEVGESLAGDAVDSPVGHGLCSQREIEIDAGLVPVQAPPLPVSYTHLDVYKRQVRDGRKTATQADLEESIEVVIAGYQKKKDVYKRQGLPRPALWRHGHSLPPPRHRRCSGPVSYTHLTACAVIQTPTNALGYLFYGAAAAAYSKMCIRDSHEPLHR